MTVKFILSFTNNVYSICAVQMEDQQHTNVHDYVYLNNVTLHLPVAARIVTSYVFHPSGMAWLFNSANLVFVLTAGQEHLYK